MHSADRRRLHAALVAVCLLPLGWLVAAALAGRLGANPVETITHTTGLWALRLLLATLAVSPIQCWLHMPWLGRFRRSFGLLAFGYASLHLLTWISFDLVFDWSSVPREVAKHPYVTAGFAAWLLLVPMALTSTRGWQRRLGPHWRRLHRLVYVAAALAVLHFFWLVKADEREPALYAALLGVVLLWRAVPRSPNAASAPRPRTDSV